MDKNYCWDSFFKLTKQALQNGIKGKLTIVLGNESCDLDSAVSSIVLAKLLRWEYLFDVNFSTTFVPILDVDRQDYALKTEIAYALSEVGISANDLIFRDDYDIKNLVTISPTQVILVDHHILSERYTYLKPYVTQIIDHRPTDDKVTEYENKVSLNIKIVGSCATLIAQRCIDSLFDHYIMEDIVGPIVFLEEYRQYADLLHSAIILDTVNFSQVVKKSTPHDEKIVKYLEKILKITNSKTYRSTKLSKLTAAKSDVSNLTAAQLLRKDAKILGPVFIPGFPILVESFLCKPNALEAIKDALKVNGCSLCILLGLKTDMTPPERDVAVYNTKNDPNAKRLSKYLQEWRAPNFQLKEVAMEDLDYFKQLNLSASRKQYMPAIDEFVKINISS